MKKSRYSDSQILGILEQAQKKDLRFLVSPSIFRGVPKGI